MGQCHRSSPSPGSLWDQRGMGHQEVEEIYTGFLEDTGAMRTKKTTWFWPTDVHSICVTVRLPPHSLHSGRDFHGCRKRVGESGRICAALYQGRCTGLRPTPKNLGSLKTIMMIILMVGVAVLATSHRVLLCMHYACYSTRSNKGAKRSNASVEDSDERPDRPKRNPQNQNGNQKGLDANPGLETSQNSQSAKSMAVPHLSNSQQLLETRA